MEFDLRGVVLLDGAWARRQGLSLPGSVNGIAVHQRARRIHFLHAIRWSWYIPKGTRVGDYVVHYADGEQVVIPLEYERDLRDWNGEIDDETAADRAKTAWVGRTPSGSLRRLYLSTWENPRPDASIATLDILTRAVADSSLSVLAITVDP